MAEPDNPEADKPADDSPTENIPTENIPADHVPAEDTPGNPDSPDSPTVPATSPPASKASRIRLIVAIGLAVVVLAGGGVALAIVASRPNPQDIALQQEKAAAREVVEKFATLLAQGRNDGAFALSKENVKTLICEGEQEALEQEWQDRENKEIIRSYAPTPSSRLTVTVKDIRIEGDKGRATLVGGTDNVRADQDYALVKETSGWKVCGVTFRPKPSTTTTQSTETGPPTGSTAPSTSETVPPGTVPTGTVPPGTGPTR